MKSVKENGRHQVDQRNTMLVHRENTFFISWMRDEAILTGITLENGQ